MEKINKELDISTDGQLSSELINRLLSLKTKLLKTKDTNQVLEALQEKKPNIISYLDLIYILIEGESDLSKIFWDAFASAHAYSAPLNSVLNIKQLTDIVNLIEEHDIKENNNDSSQLLDSFKEFVSTNGLIQKASAGHIDFKESINLGKNEILSGAIAEVNIADSFKTSLTNRYRQVLLECVLILNGVMPSIHTNNRFNDAVEPKNKIRETLSRHGLIRNFDFLVAEERKHIEDYQKRRESFSQLKDAFTFDDTPIEGHEPDSWHHDFWAEGKKLEKFVMKSLLVVNELKLFSQLLENFDQYGGIDNRLGIPNFNSFLRESSSNSTLNVPENLGYIINQSFGKLLNMVIARIQLEEKQLWYHQVVKDPIIDESELRQYFAEDELEWVDDAEGRPHLHYKDSLINIPIQSLALIAMLKESRTINNEIIKQEGPLRYGAGKDTVDIFSARRWLKDEKRKYPFYDILDIQELSDKTITIDTIKTLKNL